jgi:hypothetical protein
MLGLQVRQGLMKTWAKSEARKVHFMFLGVCESGKVRGNEPPHSQMSSHFGTWSFDGLLNLQKVIVGVKTHWIEKFIISLESSWNLDVRNGLT